MLTTNNTMVSIDQLNREVIIPTSPSRIISTVPSISELLFDLELNEQILGVTKFCVNPASLLKSKIKIGGTKNLNYSKISELNPELIVANKEENNQEQIEYLSTKYPVWISDVNNLDSALEMILEVGRITAKIEKAKNICSSIILEFQQLSKFITALPSTNKSSLYFIWQKPYMLAGCDTFINDLMQKCGLINCIDIKRYPELSVGELQKLNVNNILLSSEPFPFQEKHIHHFQSIFPNTKIILADGEMFSWYGSRLIKAPKYFISLLKQII